MASSERVAQPYAEALFRLAETPRDRDAWRGVLGTWSKVVNSPEYVALLDNPGVDQDTLIGCLLDAVGTLVAQHSRFLQALATYKRLAALPAIRDAFEERCDHAMGIVRAHVTSAFPCDHATVERLTDALSASLGHDVRCDVTVDPTLIGGLVVRVGDRVLDGSMQGRLRRLQTELLQTSTHSAPSSTPSNV